MAAKEKQILCVGLVCLDIINVVEKFPIEDTDTRCLSQRWQRGGNASNSCTVLSLLGAPCGFMGSLAPGRVSDFIYDDLRRYGIDVTNVIVHAESSFPASIVISNINSGLRTILHTNRILQSDWLLTLLDDIIVAGHLQIPLTWCQIQNDVGKGEIQKLWPFFFEVSGLNFTFCACDLCLEGSGWSHFKLLPVDLFVRNLPDATSQDFRKIDLSLYKWIHWEGRNASEQVAMIQQVEQYNATVPAEQRITTSVEIEKTREELYQLFGHGDVVFVSKDVARHFGFNSASEAVKGLYSRVKPGAYLICAWAEKGADAMGPDGVFHSNAFPPEKLVDTLGAGDTFNAAILFALSNGKSIQESLTFGCQIAGRKCGIQGYDGIV